MTSTFLTSYANNEYQNYSVIASITDYSDFEKGTQFRKESQKFIFNGKTAYKEVHLFFYPDQKYIEVKGSFFNNSILLNPLINTKSYNPKVLAFVCEFGLGTTQEGRIVFLQEYMKKMVQSLLHFEKTGDIKVENIIPSKIGDFKKFLKDNGITSQNIIRYIHFYEKFLSSI